MARKIAVFTRAPSRAAAVPVAVGLAVFALAWVALLVSHSGRKQPPPFPRPQLQAALQTGEGSAEFLRTHPWSSVRAVPLDENNWRVTVFDGPRALLDATVGPHGEVSGVAPHPGNRVPIGSRLLWSPFLLVFLTLVFCAAVAVVPLRSARNFDALVIGGGFCAELLLYKHRLIAPHMVAAGAALAYVAARAAGLALEPAADRERPRQPLLAAIGARFHPASARRLSRLGFGAVVLLGTMVIVTSTGISDIALVNLAGATVITHGQLPYGNFPPELGHGDTYPLFSYLIFLPSAVFSPVADPFDDLQGALNINSVAYLAAALLIYRTVASRTCDRRNAQLAALAWLAFPPVLIAASSGSNDVPTALFLALSLFAARRAAPSAAALTLAAWAKVVPALVLVVHVVRRLPQRRHLHAAAGVLAVTAGGVAVLLALGGHGGVAAMLDAMRFQTERGSLHSIWWQLDALGAQRVFEAATLGFAAALAWAVAFRLGLNTLRAGAAAGAAMLALVQLAGNYWNATYLPWLMVPVIVALFLTQPRQAG